MCPQPSTVSWDHFFHSMQQYFANLRQEVAPHGADPAALAAAANVYRYGTLIPSIYDFNLSSFCANYTVLYIYGSSLIIIITSFRLSRPMTRGISPAEVNGLVSVLRLVAAVASNCEAARVAIAENTAWQPLLLG